MTGERSRDLLSIQSTAHINMVFDNGLTQTFERKDPSLNTDRSGSFYGKELQFADENTDINVNSG
ncbi:hypothetical protein [Dyadobacter frigoris]|uniref:Uncharacterized protein n=1 Tax=Dyadobacter frigoris TaxID=2576211 RepID=A0A4U6D3W5_9BACT|nr:hypothetical protein [Dyadobacter frigoris]TKT88624.1 hypothetical protein FDK13_27145 [Dyadobacter frigoris]GLU54958.1 hypothetical protein Dfri01_44190 [Dyadobacter frigoris]